MIDIKIYFCILCDDKTENEYVMCYRVTQTFGLITENSQTVSVICSGISKRDFRSV